jgi:hypothetical protein
VIYRDIIPVSSARKCLLVGGVLFSFLVSIVTVSHAAPATAKPKALPQKVVAPAKPNVVPVKSVSKWTYTEDADQMRGTKTKFAMLESENSLSFGFPYEGGNATLILRKRSSDGTNIMLQIKGQFVCHSFAGGTIATKFDNGKIQKWGCNEPSDGATGVLFIEGATRFIANLKKSKSLIIEAEFYQAGPQQMRFDVAGLDWK